MKPLFSLQGSEALASLLVALPEDVSKHILSAAVRAGAEVIAERATELAPARSEKEHPHIKDSILVRAATADDLKEAGPDTVGAVVGASKRAFHADFYERGTVHQPARPFLRPAFDSTQDQAFQVIADEVGQGLAKIGAKS